ncbi:MAG: branched-chain amino acid ABC transporter substrate-binding protein, partial [candidate division WOR-3 bacterium]
LLEAIKKANSDNPVKVKEALQMIKDFKGVSGEITFDAYGNPVKKLTILRYTKSGQEFIVRITPE